MTKNYPTPVLVACTTITYAHGSRRFKLLKLSADRAQKLNVETGLTQNSLDTYVEYVQTHAPAELKIDTFLHENPPFGEKSGFTTAIQMASPVQSSCLLGITASIDVSQMDDRHFGSQFAAGVDFAYVLINSNRISRFSTGIKSGENAREY